MNDLTRPDLLKAPPVPRKAPVLRKEVVETQTWGELIVTGLLASERVGLNAHQRDPEADETETQRRQRMGTEYALFLANLMARAVLGKDNQPMYSAADWDAWNALAQDDCLKLVNKALELNGYRTLDGEDVPKNV
jgi:hypothetical protein